MSALVQRERTFLRSVGDEPLPGYRLIAPLGIGGFGEVWKCLAPGGLHKAIKFVGADPDDDPDERTSLQQEYDAFERVKGIRHPFLMTLERVELIDGELLMVMELADRSLAQRYDECREAGLPGIPRNELLSYMVDAAEALDVLGREHGLQHLDVKPANLFLLGGHVKVGDYGLVARHRTSLSGEEPKLGRGLTPKYVAPEILADRVHARSDQYPLALVYQELLTGAFPYPGRSSRQLLLQHTSAEPDLSPLPAGDREAVGRALSKNPIQRFPTCLGFVKALLRKEGFSEVTPLPPPRLPTATQTPALVTPSARPCPSAAPDATIRFNPTVPNWAGALEASEPSVEFERTHPGWTHVAECPPTARGRVIRALDVRGRPHLIHSLKLPAGSACDTALRALASPSAGVFQTLIRPYSQAVSFGVPEAGSTLSKWMTDRKATGAPALRRPEIRAILASVAAALDALHTRHAFAHGLLSPTTVLQIDGAWGITLYGMGELLHLTSAERAWMRDELYAAPEAVSGRAVAAGDQYSLALLYLALAGAWSPPERRAQRNDSGAAALHFDRHALLECEAAAVRKATAGDPAKRFRSCAEFLAALQPPANAGVILEGVSPVESLGRLAGQDAPADSSPKPERLTDALLRGAGALAVASWPSADSDGLVVTQPDGRLSCRFPVKLSADLALLKIRAFQDQHGLELVKWTAFTYALKPYAGKLGATGKGIELVVQLPSGEQTEASELAVVGRAIGTGERKRADEQILVIIEQFRRAVQNTHERRRASRFRCELPILVYPVDDELAVRAPIAGTCRDVSATGFACVLPGAPATGHAFVTFPSVPDFGKWALLAKIVRTGAAPAGGSLVAGRFVHAGVS